MDSNEMKARMKRPSYWLKVHAYELSRAAQCRQYFIPELLGATIAIVLAVLTRHC